MPWPEMGPWAEMGRWPEMGRWREPLTRRALAGAVAPLLASLLLIAAVIAPAHCLARHVPASHAALCLATDAPGEPDPGHHAGGACPVCAGLAQMAPAPPAALPAPAARIEAVAHVAASVPAKTAPPRAFAQPRAPPAA